MQRDHMMGWPAALVAVDAPVESLVGRFVTPVRAPMSPAERAKRARIDTMETLKLGTAEAAPVKAKTKPKNLEDEADEVFDDLLDMLKRGRRTRPACTGWYVANFAPEGQKLDVRTAGKVIRHWDANAQRWSMAMPIDASRRRYSITGYQHRTSSSHNQSELQGGMVWFRPATDDEIAGV